jgi:hypothetical protein
MGKWLSSADEREDICVDGTGPTGPSTNRVRVTFQINQSKTVDKLFSKLLDKDSIPDAQGIHLTEDYE